MAENEFARSLREFLKISDESRLRDFCETGHAASVADFVSVLKPKEIWALLQYAMPKRRAEIFSHLGEDLQLLIIENLPRAEIAGLLSDMAPDDRVDLFRMLPPDKRETILPALAQAEREDIRRLASYEEGTAGSIMTSDYATASPDFTASETITHLRKIAPDKETVYYTFVVDNNRNLLGLVTLKDLILAKADEKVEHIMNDEIVSVRVDDDQEDAARLIQKYDLVALPVLDEHGALVGIITHDDIMDVITQEQTEDMEKLMAIGGRHEAAAYIRTPATVHFKNRVGWIVGLALLGMVSGFLVQRFEGLLLQFAILAAFMPMVADTGGNTGSQSATLVIRALALDEVTPGDIFRILWKEAKVSVMIGLLLGALTFARVYFFGGGSVVPEGFSLERLGFAIALAIGLQVVSATLIGAMLPLIAARLKVDPAVVASPALTTVVDITGLLIYFTTVKLLLGI